MPIPLILGAVTAIAGAAGVGTGIHGAVKMKDAKDTMEIAKSHHEANIARFEKTNKATTSSMDELGKLELETLKSFDTFSNIIEKIQNRPDFTPYQKDGVTLPKYERETLKNVSVGAGVLLGGLGGAAAGTAGGFAAAGATTAAVMALGTASTGTAIASLSGAAAVNATLAALGGGALAAGGGGVALGTTLLGASTLGIGLLVGGIIFNFTGSKLSEKADEAYAQMKRAEKEIDAACKYLVELKDVSEKYRDTIGTVKGKYDECLNYISYVVNTSGKTDWLDFTNEEQLATQNAILLVGLLYNMCKVSLVKKAEKEGQPNEINNGEIQSSIANSEKVMSDIFG